jgi:hypothetical protein
MLRLAVLALLASFSGACGVANDETDAEQRTQSTRDSRAAPLLRETPGFLDLMPDAHSRTRYRGHRRVHMEYTVRGEVYDLSYREEAVSDGAGNFKIVPLEVTNSVLTKHDEELFLLMQGNREGFVFRYRDFRVRDVERFLDSYGLSLEGSDDSIAGVECERIRVERLDHPAFYYRAWVDPRNGLVLRWEQRTPAGALLAEVEFEDIDYQPNLTDGGLRGNLFEGNDLDPMQDLSEQAGFTTLDPQLLPTGYRLVSATLFTDDSGQKWLEREYGDGCDVLSLLQSAPLAGSGPAPARMDELELGTWTLYAGEIHRSQVIAMGRAGKDAIRQFLQSSSFGK